MKFRIFCRREYPKADISEAKCAEIRENLVEAERNKPETQVVKPEIVVVKFTGFDKPLSETMKNLATFSHAGNTSGATF